MADNSVGPVIEEPLRADSSSSMSSVSRPDNAGPSSCSRSPPGLRETATWHRQPLPFDAWGRFVPEHTSAGSPH